MLYVAITRAKNRCTIHLPEYQQVQNSSLALLFEESQRPNLQQLVKQLAKQLPQSIAVSVSKAAPTNRNCISPEVPFARKFQGSIDRTAMIASFTGLNTDRIQVEEQERRRPMPPKSQRKKKQRPAPRFSILPVAHERAFSSMLSWNDSTSPLQTLRQQWMSS
jgi:ATP-dependent exoDNAse (exonuclease V) beta subunit